jgi:hypothetical protein
LTGTWLAAVGYELRSRELFLPLTSAWRGANRRLSDARGWCLHPTGPVPLRVGADAPLAHHRHMPTRPSPPVAPPASPRPPGGKLRARTMAQCNAPTSTRTVAVTNPSRTMVTLGSDRHQHAHHCCVSRAVPETAREVASICRGGPTERHVAVPDTALWIPALGGYSRRTSRTVVEAREPRPLTRAPTSIVRWQGWWRGPTVRAGR